MKVVREFFHTKETKKAKNYRSVSDAVHATQPPTNGVVVVAAGQGHALALTSSNTVIAWGLTTSPAATIPTGRNLTNITAIACGYNFSLVLSNNGTVFAWGDNSYGQTNIPTYVNNVAAISAGGTHALALQSNGTVLYWGSGTGPTNPPNALLGPTTVAIASGGDHDLALLSTGNMVAWGLNNYGQTNIPNYQSNVMAIAAGDNHSVALLNNGTIVVWGNNANGQTNIPQVNPTYPLTVKLLAAGGNHTMAGIFSPLVQYPVNVSKDLLLIYNSTSADSWNVCEYYRTNRPMVSTANELGINCTTNETIAPSDYTNLLVFQVNTWLTNNPTKRPAYVILFPFTPARVSYYGEGGLASPSVQYQLHNWCLPGWFPLVTAINMNGTGGTNDCIAYINKLRSIGSNLPGRLILSGSAAGFGNANYYFDDSRAAFFTNYPTIGSNAVLGVLALNPAASITYKDIAPDSTLADHLTNGLNVAGYLCWGTHSTLSTNYATNGTVSWTGNSGWWLIRTAESFNGDRIANGFGNFLSWFASSAFGGVNYANTPVGAVSYTDEPDATATFDETYFGLWESGKSFAICAWNSINTQTALNFYPQNLGDPFVTK